MRSFVLALLVCLAACAGTPSAVDVCKTTCDKTGSCQGETPTEIQTCKTGCDTNAAATYASCKNASAVLACQNGCTQQSCTDFPNCQDGCPKCMQ